VALFLLDEQLSDSFANALRAIGHEAFTAKALGLRSAPDRQVLEQASELAAILITSDRGFGDLRAYPLGSHAGIILLRLEPRLAYPQIINRFIDALVEVPLDQMAGALCVVDASNVRIRRPE
jgi:predicted nuclease of predicted toxin-antitoxin system